MLSSCCFKCTHSDPLFSLPTSKWKQYNTSRICQRSQQSTLTCRAQCVGCDIFDGICSNGVSSILCCMFSPAGRHFIMVVSAAGHGGDIAVGILQQVSLDLFEMFCLNCLLLPADHLHFPIHTLHLPIEPDATVAALRNMI